MCYCIQLVYKNTYVLDSKNDIAVLLKKNMISW